MEAKDIKKELRKELSFSLGEGEKFDEQAIRGRVTKIFDYWEKEKHLVIEDAIDADALLAQFTHGVEVDILQRTAVGLVRHLVEGVVEILEQPAHELRHGLDNKFPALGRNPPSVDVKRDVVSTRHCRAESNDVVLTWHLGTLQ